MEKNKQVIRTFDLFCGAGGSSHGAAMAGVVPVAALDMWDIALDTYQINFPDAVTYRMKASSLSPHRLLNEVGKIDLLLASPECTSHSVARGKKPRCEESQATAFEVIRFAKVLKPRWVVVENVLQMRRWNLFNVWHEKLKKLGYKTQIGILDAQFYGTPQSRRRLFIVADLEFEPSLPKPGSQATKTAASIIGYGEPKDQQWAFTLLNRPGRSKQTIARAKRAIDSLGDDAEFIMVYYGTDGAGGFQTLDRPLRTITTLDRFAYIRRNGQGHEMRMLQPPELAKAMGFPSCHQWTECSRRERIKMIGNAVCPLVMKQIITNLIQRSNK